jgi:tetratricopeptide (TPR) repeat protein
MGCFTCQEPTATPTYMCPQCKTVAGIADLKRATVAGLDQLATAQRAMQAELGAGLRNIASILEWGFDEVSWQLHQQTETLRGIDLTLKTPAETQANEWRLMAEELRRRGVLNRSEEFFLKGLEANPLDYRLYIGLARTYLQSDRFGEALAHLEESIPHAPGNGFDYRSYSHRMIGRIHASEGRYESAVGALESAIRFAPDYTRALYEHAEYCGQCARVEACLASLRKAVLADSGLFAVAETDPLLDPVRPSVAALLADLVDSASKEAQVAASSSEASIARTESALDRARHIFRKCSNRDDAIEPVSSGLEAAKVRQRTAVLGVAMGNYEQLLEVPSLAEQAQALAETACAEAERRCRHYHDTFLSRVENSYRAGGRAFGIGCLVGVLTACPLGAGLGALIGLLLGHVADYAEGGLVVGLWLAAIAGVVMFVTEKQREVYRYRD